MYSVTDRNGFRVGILDPSDCQAFREFRLKMLEDIRAMDLHDIEASYATSHWEKTLSLPDIKILGVYAGGNIIGQAVLKLNDDELEGQDASLRIVYLMHPDRKVELYPMFGETAANDLAEHHKEKPRLFLIVSEKDSTCPGPDFSPVSAGCDIEEGFMAYVKNIGESVPPELKRQFVQNVPLPSDTPNIK